MKTCLVFAALAAASLAAVPAYAHYRTPACGHVSQRPIVHRAVSHHIVRRPAVRHLAARTTHHSVQYAACGCGHEARARIVYEDHEYRPRHWPRYAATYYHPRPIFYRPRMAYYEADFSPRRFHEHGRYGRGFGGAYFHHRDRDFEHRRFAMRDDWGR